MADGFHLLTARAVGAIAEAGQYLRQRRPESAGGGGRCEAVGLSLHQRRAGKMDGAGWLSGGEHYRGAGAGI